MSKFLKTKHIVAALIAVLTFLVFLPALRNEFVRWDDHEYVYENLFIRSLNAKLIKSAFLTFKVSNWHPLTWISHAIDYSLWGLNPFGHHLTNIFLHALNTFLVTLLVMVLLEAGHLFSLNRQDHARLRGDTGKHSDKHALIAAAATGLLFGLHPLHVESVAWISERKDLLCAFFFLLSLMAFVKYVRNKSMSSVTGKTPRPAPAGRYYFFALGLFALALLSKPMAITLPLVLLILEWYPFGRIRSWKTFCHAVLEKIPFFILSFVSGFLTILAQKGEGAMKLMEFMPLSIRLFVAAKSVIAYLWKMLLPLHLTPLYPYPRHISLLSFGYLSAIVLLVGMTAICVLIARKRPLWLGCWSYYLITLFPVLGIVQVGVQSMADRYTYLPSLGPFLIAGLIAGGIYEKMTELKRLNIIVPVAGLVLAMAILVSLSSATIKQIGVWKNSISFWHYVIENGASEIPIPHNYLGMAYANQGQLDLAIAEYRTALHLADNYAGNYAEAHNNLGVAYAHKGQLDMAMAEYQAAIRLTPNYPEAHNNLGLVYASRGQLDLAMAEYKIALLQLPDFAPAHNNLGSIYFSEGLLDMAMKEYQAAVDLNPDSAEAHYNLAVTYLKKGLLDAAAREAERTVRIRPDLNEARQLLNEILSTRR